VSASLEPSAPKDRGQRWSALLALLAEHGRLSVSQVSSELEVSESTVRRDFGELAAQQLVTRTHGGVVATSVAYELPARYKSALANDDKQRIARAAALMVDPGTVVGFNGGTTTSATARHLAARGDLARSSDRPAITVVSNALNIASEMVLRPFIRCVSLGGVARPESYEQSGPLAAMVLEQLWLDTLILGVDALSATDGASCSHDGEAGISSRMVRRADRVIAVVKAYTTRVGSGPFPTELIDADGEKLRAVGAEFGTTTGRPRRCGWYDAVIARYAARVNGVTDFVLTKLDVLSGFDRIPVCVAYRLPDGRVIDEMPMTQTDFHHAEPVYEEFPGWREDISTIREFDDLPKNARAYIEALQAMSGVPFSVVGVGPARDQTLQLRPLA